MRNLLIVAHSFSGDLLILSAGVESAVAVFDNSFMWLSSVNVRNADVGQRALDCLLGMKDRDWLLQ